MPLKTSQILHQLSTTLPKPTMVEPTSPRSPRSPDILLGRYQLDHLLGRGSFAKVYSARSLADDAVVAIKIIDKSTIPNATMEAQIIREVAVMHRLHHPNVVRIHEVMATKSKIYMVMEYVRGGDMYSKIVRCGRLTELTAQRYFQQLVRTIHYCHAKGVVHRDIKPHNLLLDLEGNLKVSDFGFAALLEPETNGLLETACGTPAYTAPEVVGRREYAGEKADAWSCGIILYVFLAGCIPFDDNNIIIMYSKIRRRELQFPPWFSKPVKRIISRLLDPNPDTRMSIEELMDCDWVKKIFRSESAKEFKCVEKRGDAIPRAPSLNAFDIISMSPSLDLSMLFERKRKEKRFTSTCSLEKILERVDEVGENLGYNVERMKGGVIGLVNGKLSILVHVTEVTEALFLVNLEIGDAEDVELEEGCWGELKAGLGDIVAWQCQGQGIC